MTPCDRLESKQVQCCDTGHPYEISHRATGIGLAAWTCEIKAVGREPTSCPHVEQSPGLAGLATHRIESTVQYQPTLYVPAHAVPPLFIHQ
jgi:hypothetical protein